MLISINVKMALSSLRTTKLRSALTMLGIIIGVLSVVTMVSIGEGVKQKVAQQIGQSGNLITVRPGHLVRRDQSGNISTVNLLSSFSATTFTTGDLAVIDKVPGVKLVTPMSLVNGMPQVDNTIYDEGLVIATRDNVGTALNQKLEFGSFFSDKDKVQDGAVIGKRVAEKLFQENVPIGRLFMIRGHEFRVRGIFEDTPSSPLIPYSDYGNAVFIPYEKGKQINGEGAQIYQVLIKVKDGEDQNKVINTLTENLKQAHSGQTDFTVLKQNETYALASNILNQLTSFVAGIAAVSLLVGGIGIMNIMLVSVTERTREIGIRKAVGATNRQIMSQFLIEAMVLSFSGGIIGVMLSFLTNYLLHVTTSLEPVINLPIIAIASGVAIFVGILFGIAPAAKAARKDPIDALRSI
jgi:putative ABC transport system permease protein